MKLRNALLATLFIAFGIVLSLFSNVDVVVALVVTLFTGLVLAYIVDSNFRGRINSRADSLGKWRFRISALVLIIVPFVLIVASLWIGKLIWEQNTPSVKAFIQVPKSNQILDSKTISFRSEIEGFRTPPNYIWFFGDSSLSSDEKNPYHEYRIGGDYRITLIVQGSDGEFAFDSITVHINEEPKAAFDIQPYPASGEAPFRVSFYNKSTDDGRLIDYFWSFGDGTSSTTEHPDHVYQRPGQYLVRLKITDDTNRSHFSEQIIEVREPVQLPQPPVASFSVSNPEPYLGQYISLNATQSFDSDGRITEFRWDFNGDDNADVIRSNPILVERFLSEGSHLIALTVVDDRNYMNTISQELFVRKRETTPVSLGLSMEPGWVFGFLGALNTTLSISSSLHEDWLLSVGLREAREFIYLNAASLWIFYPLSQYAWIFHLFHSTTVSISPYLGLGIETVPSEFSVWPWLIGVAGFKTEYANLKLMGHIKIALNRSVPEFNLLFPLFEF